MSGELRDVFLSLSKGICDMGQICFILHMFTGKIISDCALLSVDTGQ